MSVHVQIKFKPEVFLSLLIKHKKIHFSLYHLNACEIVVSAEFKLKDSHNRKI